MIHSSIGMLLREEELNRDVMYWMIAAIFFKLSAITTVTFACFIYWQVSIDH
jgi:hypothetical protein